MSLTELDVGDGEPLRSSLLCLLYAYCLMIDDDPENDDLEYIDHPIAEAGSLPNMPGVAPGGTNNDGESPHIILVVRAYCK